MVKNICIVCSKLLKSKTITFEGKKFCCQKCCTKFKKAKKQKICEFC